MNMLKLSALLLLVTILSSCSSMSMLVRRSNKVQVCGRELSQMLSLVCGGIYYDPGATTTTEATTQADSSNFVERDLFPGRLFKGADLYAYLFRSAPSSYRIPALNYERMARQEQEEGIVDECCRRPCTINVLSSYCNGR